MEHKSITCGRVADSTDIGTMDEVVCMTDPNSDITFSEIVDTESLDNFTKRSIGTSNSSKVASMGQR